MEAMPEYPVVSVSGAVLGYAATLGEAEAVFAYHYPRRFNADGVKFDERAKLPKPVYHNGFTFHLGWVEQAE